MRVVYIGEGHRPSFAQKRIWAFQGQYDNRLRGCLASRGLTSRVPAAVNLPGPVRVAVILQQMLIPEFSGVAFTRDPVTGRHTVVIEAVHGLSESLVSVRKDQNGG
ncbi:PEP/pyruvate-binding domain-containing protein [Arthrobacter sp. YN]|uniref:PEP/pyruvate-binding domain-containing protein n=1 Tax=Arthrobacter sp. YN TaxID=2020486 RepID=UPI000B615963|nr:hypothetical protein CGK93_19710 [Arthrobacter sp. YN]